MLAVYVATALCVGWYFVWLVWRARRWQRGSGTAGLSWREGLTRLATYLGTHRTVRRDRYAGWMHALIFWGTVILLVATTLVGIQDHTGWIFLNGNRYLVFKLVSNLGGVSFVTGLGMALWRRRDGSACDRLKPDPNITWLLWGMMVLALTGFGVEAARIAVDFPAFERWSIVGYAGAKVLALIGLAGGPATVLHRALWMTHATIAVGFFVVVPLSLLRHIFLASYTVMAPIGAPGVMTVPASPVTGAAGLEQFRVVDLVQADACLTCGRCTEVCPAAAAGKPLSPRSVVLGLRQHLDEPEVPLAEQVADDALWSCTSCHACDEACPIGIRIFDKIATMRRGLISAGAVPPTLADALESVAQRFNPFGRPNSARMEWASGLRVPVAEKDEPVELLYWVGCAGAFDPAGREVSRAVVTVLEHLKIRYRTLGCGERCTGDAARRVGEEGLWRELARRNLGEFAAHGVKLILTQCPHCYNAFKNEYPTVGPTPRVIHHSEWLRDRLQDGSLRLQAGTTEKITFHDPCYLARANAQTAAPRTVLAQMGDGAAVEMARHGSNSACCGGGGGQIWLDVRGTSRVETNRAREAEATGAQTVATGCPYCRVMLEAGRSNLPAGQGRWRVRDLAELVVESLDSNSSA